MEKMPLLAAKIPVLAAGPFLKRTIMAGTASPAMFISLMAIPPVFFSMALFKRVSLRRASLPEAVAVLSPIPPMETVKRPIRLLSSRRCLGLLDQDIDLFFQICQLLLQLFDQNHRLRFVLCRRRRALLTRFFNHFTLLSFCGMTS